MDRQGRRAAAWVAARRLAVAGLGALVLGACASAPPVAAGPTRELVMAYDDARASGPIAFPSDTYESVVRFQLPDGEHQPLRLRFQAEAPGSLEITIYGTTLFETPGDAIRTLKRELAKEDVSDGRDGRWVVEDLGDLKPLKGVVWVGVHRLGGSPSIWASGVVSNPMGLLPTKRTPMIRLEVALASEGPYLSSRCHSSPTATGAASRGASQSPAARTASPRLSPRAS